MHAFELPVSQEIRHPSQKGGDVLRIFAPPRSESPRNISPQGGESHRNIAPFRNLAPPPYKFDLKTKRLQVEKIYCVIYLFITRRQNYIHILGFLAAGGGHSIVHWIVNFPCQCQWCNRDSWLPQRKLHHICDVVYSNNFMILWFY
jgi:hypothetical protein